MASATHARACHGLPQLLAGPKNIYLYILFLCNSSWWAQWGTPWPEPAAGGVVSKDRTVSATRGNGTKAAAWEQGFRTHSLLHRPGHWTGLTEGKTLYAKWTRVFHYCKLVKAESLSEASLHNQDPNPTLRKPRNNRFLLLTSLLNGAFYTSCLNTNYKQFTFGR